MHVINNTNRKTVLNFPGLASLKKIHSQQRKNALLTDNMNHLISKLTRKASTKALTGLLRDLATFAARANY